MEQLERKQEESLEYIKKLLLEKLASKNEPEKKEIVITTPPPQTSESKKSTSSIQSVPKVTTSDNKRKSKLRLPTSNSEEGDENGDLEKIIKEARDKNNDIYKEINENSNLFNADKDIQNFEENKNKQVKQLKDKVTDASKSKINSDLQNAIKSVDIKKYIESY